mmetsp:Transcript_16115/g.24302  ORF Transcript_16115/g.24302 Transcript_16115/m.24302 type:complete len:251 (-) Transcript_16115:53-805(-)
MGYIGFSMKVFAALMALMAPSVMCQGSQKVRSSRTQLVPRPMLLRRMKYNSLDSAMQVDLRKSENKALVRSAIETAEMVTQREYDIWVAEQKKQGEESYERLKKKLLVDTVYVAAFVSLYFAVNGVSIIDILTSSVGGAASYLYALALMRDIDRIGPGDPTPMLDLKEYKGSLKWPLKILTAYTYSLRPRLAVPIGLAVLMVVLDAQGLIIPLSARGTGFAGFLSFNVALLGTAFSEVLSIMVRKEIPKE